MGMAILNILKVSERIEGRHVLDATAVNSARGGGTET